MLDNLGFFLQKARYYVVCGHFAWKFSVNFRQPISVKNTAFRPEITRIFLPRNARISLVLRLLIVNGLLVLLLRIGGGVGVDRFENAVR